MLPSERDSRSWLTVALLVSSGLYQPSPIVTASWAALIGCLVLYYCNYGVLPEITRRIQRTELELNKVVCVNVYYLCDAAPPAGTEFQVECMLSTRWPKWTLRLAAVMTFVFDVAQRLTMVAMICCCVGIGWHQYASVTLWERCFSALAWSASFLCLIATLEGIGYALYERAGYYRSLQQRLDAFLHLAAALQQIESERQQLPRVVTTARDGRAAVIERDYRAVEVLRLILSAEIRVPVGTLRNLLEQARLTPVWFEAIGGERLNEKLLGCSDEWKFGCETDNGEMWRFGSWKVLDSKELEPIYWG